MACSNKKKTTCVRQFVTFLIRFTMLAAYTVAGAFLFQALEETRQPIAKEKEDLLVEIEKNLTSTYNMTDSEFAKLKANFEYALSSTDKQWTIANSITFVTTVITTIGYGDLTPRTSTGQIVCIVYALFGIPVAALFLSNVGDIISKTISCLLRKCITGREGLVHMVTMLVIVLLTVGILFVGAAGLHVSTNWTLVESLYCWFITFSTIGFGDFIPGNELREPSPGGMSREVIETMWRLGYVYIGLALLASILTSLSEMITRNQSKQCKCLNASVSELEDDETPYGIYQLKPVDAIRSNGFNDNY